MSRPEDDEEPPEAKGKASAAARPSELPDAGQELRNAFSSLKNAAGALFGNVQPAIKEVLDEADRVYQQAKASAKPAVAGVAEEAGRVVKQIGETAEPLARSMGGELHKFSEVMADAVEGVFKGTRGAVSAARSAIDPARPADDQSQAAEPTVQSPPNQSGRDDD